MTRGDLNNFKADDPNEADREARRTTPFPGMTLWTTRNSKHYFTSTRGCRTHFRSARDGPVRWLFRFDHFDLELAERLIGGQKRADRQRGVFVEG